MSTYDRFNKQVLLPPVEPGQYLSIRYTERLEEAGAVASVGSKGDSHDCEQDGPAAGMGLTLTMTGS